MYKIEGNLSFFEELQKEEEIKEDKICHISHLPLEEDHVTLECGHTFNYIYLFQELYSKRFLSFLSAIPKNLSFKIRCPYCRKSQPNVIPYSAKSNFGKIYGINDLECENYKNQWRCKYMKKNKIVCNCCFTMPLKETGIYYCEKHFQSSLSKYIKENTPKITTEKPVALKCSFKDKKKCPNKLFEDGLCKKHYHLKINAI